jgi:Aerotolerance regulator N-terminal
MQLFLNPWYMIAGAALVSLPIIIHLINRMRFKRIRWAAMEFLLKSQKRNRRRLIIEQMILLLLRCLLVLLVGFLLGRFVGCAPPESAGQGTMHIMILDDTLSMADRWVQDGDVHNALGDGKEQIRAVSKTAAQANSPQYIQVFLLSDVAMALENEKPGEDRQKLLAGVKPIYSGRLGDKSDADLNRVLDPVKTTALHIDPVKAIQSGRELFAGVVQGQKILHLVSDFRDSDWGSGPQLEELHTQIGKLLEKSVNLSLQDVAHPNRNDFKGATVNHDNLAIVDFRAESRMAAEDVPLEFTVVVQNFGTTDAKSPLSVFVNGAKDFQASVPLERLPAGDRFEQKFSLQFHKTRPTPEFIHVSAQIDREKTGVQGDNVRDLVIELRKKIPALIVDGAGRDGQKPGGDSFHLEIAFLSGKAFEAEYKTLVELDTLDLSVYPSIYLLNVPEIKNKETLDKLQKYVKNGGSVAYFLGDKANRSFYNKTLHEDYKGLFPVKIAEKYTDAPTPEEREFRKFKDKQPKIKFRDPKHPIVAEGLAPFKEAFLFLMIDRYWPTMPRSQWNPEVDTEKVEEVVTLPNRKEIAAYREQAQDLGKQAALRTEELAAADPKFEKYVSLMTDYRREITKALSEELLYKVSAVLDRMLNDPGDPTNPAGRPSMPELWAQPRMKALASQLKGFRETIEFGDPLVLTRRYGKGRVAVCLTSAGTDSKWNDWGGGPEQWSYPVFIKDFQRYLTSESADLNRIVTPKAGIRVEMDGDKFQDVVDVVFQPQPNLEEKPTGPNPDARPDPERFKRTMSAEKKKLPTNEEKKLLVLNFDDAVRPGVYSFEFRPIDETKQPSEFRSYAFNVDAGAESNLKRADKDKLEVKTKNKDARAGKVMVFAQGDSLDVFKGREPDASEKPWLYLLFLIVLVAEQALAVHLSFHLKPSDTAAAPARPQVAAA